MPIKKREHGLDMNENERRYLDVVIRGLEQVERREHEHGSLAHTRLGLHHECIHTKSTSRMHTSATLSL